MKQKTKTGLRIFVAAAALCACGMASAQLAVTPSLPDKAWTRKMWLPRFDEKKALAASAALEELGFLVPAIRYPTVARGVARLRVALMSAHTPEQLRSAAAAIAANCTHFRGENLV